jgi:hypothetical protein
MSATAAVLVRTFSVGKRIVTLTLPKPERGRALCMTCEWAPETPQQLSEIEWKQYRAGRDAALGELVNLTGMRTLVVEI